MGKRTEKSKQRRAKGRRLASIEMPKLAESEWDVAWLCSSPIYRPSRFDLFEDGNVAPSAETSLEWTVSSRWQFSTQNLDTVMVCEAETLLQLESKLDCGPMGKLFFSKQDGIDISMGFIWSSCAFGPTHGMMKPMESKQSFGEDQFAKLSALLAEVAAVSLTIISDPWRPVNGSRCVAGVTHCNFPPTTCFCRF